MTGRSATATDGGAAAQAKGGTLYIGIEDGTKRVVGVRKANKLMEDIPNSIRNTMGIVADVVLIRKEGKDVIRIKVPASSFPVSYHGGYFYRTGAVKMQMVGNALTDFILRKTNSSWDACKSASGKHVDDCRFTVLVSLAAIRLSPISSVGSNSPSGEAAESARCWTPIRCRLPTHVIESRHLSPTLSFGSFFPT